MMEREKITAKKSLVETGQFAPEKVAIATTTFYSDWYPGRANLYMNEQELTKDQEKQREHKVRGDLALKMARQAKNNGYNLVVVDGGSSQAFINELQETKACVFAEQEKGMSASRRQAIRLASQVIDAKVIVWTEPEKVSFIYSLQKAVEPLFNGESDVVIPERRKSLFKETYPDYQSAIEEKSNLRWHAVMQEGGVLGPTDLPFDMWFGPRAFINDPEIVALTQLVTTFTSSSQLKMDVSINSEAWFDATFLFVIKALMEGYTVTKKTIPYRHPKIQTQIERNSPYMKDKRDLQYRSIILCAIHFLRCLAKEKNSSAGRQGFEPQ